MTANLLVNALPHFADRWATAMFRALWQGGIAILIVWAVCLIIPSLPARIKCWLWRLAAVKMVISLLWLSPLQIPLLPSPPVMSAGTSSSMHLFESHATLQQSAPLRSFDSQLSLAETTPHIHWFSFRIALLMIWVVGVVAGFIRILAGWRYVRKLRAGAESVGNGFHNGQLIRLCQAMKISILPVLAESTAVSAPVLIGVLRPGILLPKGTFPPEGENLEIVLAHELAHLRRGDMVWNWLNSLVGVVFFFNPLVWLLMQESRLACETACDAMAVRVTGRDPISYTRVLVDLAAIQSGRPTTRFAVIGMIETAGTLDKRIRSLLRAKHLGRRTLFFAGILTAVLAFPGLMSWQLVQRAAPGEGFAATTITTQPAGTSITGQVLTADGKPAVGATVYLETYQPDGSAELTQRAQSGSTGYFSMNAPTDPGPRITGGDRKLFAVLPGVGFTRPADDTASPLELHLGPVVDVPLTFVGPDNRPAAGFRVWPRLVMFGLPRQGLSVSYLQIAEDIGKQWSATTDSDGNCTIRGMPTGAYVYLDSDDERYARMTFQERVQIQFAKVAEPRTIHLMPASSIAGAVINPETLKPVPGVTVMAQGTNENPLGGGETTTDADGLFSLTRLRSGPYVVTILHLDQTAPDWTVRAADARLPEGQSVRVDLTLTHGGVLSGKVLDAPTGKGIPGVAVGLYGPAHPKYAASIESRFTDKDGFYSFRTPSGKQHVYLSGEVPDGYRPTLAAFDPTVHDGQTTTVNFNLRPNGFPTVNGLATDADGKPIAGATILCDDSIDPSPMGNTHTVISGTDGRFRITHVQPGSVIRARWKNLATEAPITVRGGAANVELQLGPSAFYTLIVRAIDENGSIIPTATVSLVVWSSGYGAGMEPKRSDAKGTIVFDSLLADTKYSLSAESPGYGVAQLNVETPPISTPRQRVVSLVLKKASSVLAGIVVDQNDAPVPFAPVNISGTETGLQSTEADSHGHFEFSVVPEAHHVVLWAGPAMGARVQPKTATADAGNMHIKLLLPSRDAP